MTALFNLIFYSKNIYSENHVKTYFSRTFETLQSHPFGPTCIFVVQPLCQHYFVAGYTKNCCFQYPLFFCPILFSKLNHHRILEHACNHKAHLPPNDKGLGMVKSLT